MNMDFANISNVKIERFPWLSSCLLCKMQAHAHDACFQSKVYVA